MPAEAVPRGPRLLPRRALCPEAGGRGRAETGQLPLPGHPASAAQPAGAPP